MVGRDLVLQPLWWRHGLLADLGTRRQAGHKNPLMGITLEQLEANHAVWLFCIFNLIACIRQMLELRDKPAAHKRSAAVSDDVLSCKCICLPSKMTKESPGAEELTHSHENGNVQASALFDSQIKAVHHVKGANPGVMDVPEQHQTMAACDDTNSSSYLNNKLRAPPAILEDIKQSLQMQHKDVELRRLEVKLESKRLELQTQLEVRKLELEHILKMAELKSRIGDTEMDEVNAIPAPSSMITRDEPPEGQAAQPPKEQASQPPAEDADLELQPYSVKLPRTLAAVWEMYIHEVKLRDDALTLDATQTLYDGESTRRKALGMLRVIAEELENRSRVLGARRQTPALRLLSRA